MKASIQRNRAFTLIEIILAVGIVAILTGSIVAISTSILNLTTTLLDEQERQIHVDDFENHIRNTLTKLTAASQPELTIDEQNQGVQTLIIQQPNSYFPLNGSDNLATQSVLSTQFNSNGLLSIVQSNYLEEEIQNIDLSNPNHSIVLAEDLIQVQWEFFHPTSNEWVSDWQPDLNLGIPKQVRFTYQFSGEPQQNLFIWLLNQ